MILPMNPTASYLLILEPSLADDDIFYSHPVSVLLLMDGVVLKQLLSMLFGNVVQGIFVDYPCTFMLNKSEQECNL